MIAVSSPEHEAGAHPAHQGHDPGPRVSVIEECSLESLASSGGRGNLLNGLLKQEHVGFLQEWYSGGNMFNF